MISWPCPGVSKVSYEYDTQGVKLMIRSTRYKARRLSYATGLIYFIYLLGTLYYCMNLMDLLDLMIYKFIIYRFI